MLQVKRRLGEIYSSYFHSDICSDRVGDRERLLVWGVVGSDSHKIIITLSSLIFVTREADMQDRGRRGACRQHVQQQERYVCLSVKEGGKEGRGGKERESGKRKEKRENKRTTAAV